MLFVQKQIVVHHMTYQLIPNNRFHEFANDGHYAEFLVNSSYDVSSHCEGTTPSLNDFGEVLRGAL